MKNQLRRLLAVGLGLGISLTGVSTAFAANLTWSADYTVDMSDPDVNFTILSGSEADSLITGPSNLKVVVGNGDTFTVRSIDRNIIVTGNSSATITQSCESGSIDQVIITGGGSAETITLFPGSSSCSSGSGGGGGGGGGSSAPSTPTTPTVPTTPSVSAHPAGSVVKAPGSSAVFFITSDGKRRGFTSPGAFLSYGFLNFSLVVDANTADMALPEGPLVAPRDGIVFCADKTDGTDVKGECSLITNGMKAAFTSAAVFKGLGFDFKNARYGSSAFLAKTANLSSATMAHPAGSLVNNNGTIQLVANNGVWGIPSMDVFTSWGYSLSDVVPANAADKAKTQVGIMPTRAAGQLSLSY